MTIDLKYDVGQQVVIDLEDSYRFAKITGYEAVASKFTSYGVRIKYELLVPDSMLNRQGKEVPLEPRTVWATEDRIRDLLAKLKIEKEKSPTSKPATLLWNMRAEDSKKEKNESRTKK